MGWTVNEDGYLRLHLRDLARERAIPAPPVDGEVTGFDFTDAGTVAFEFSSASSTTDIWIWDWRAPQLTKATHSTYAGIDPAQFIDPELVHYPSFDGREIPAFLYLPPAYRPGTPVPFVVHVHGGPESQFRPGFIRHFQYLLLHGYGILAPNVRGSSGYGREYMELDNYTKRLDSVKDLKAGADYLIAKGYTAPGMLAVKGGSYGGYMTLAAITEYPSLFSAAVDEVGIANFVSFLENTAEYRRYLREAEYGPLTDRDFLESISPLNKADRITTPLLVIHGENDPRVPVGEARQIIAALEARSTPVDSLIFPDEGHGASKRPNVIATYRKMVEFLDAHLGDKKPWGGTEQRP
jgi:dipeptidyl aminopeptidase/acylaminoacyl peptidase